MAYLCWNLVPIFFMIVFFQSSIDKVIDRAGNLIFFKAHFKNTIFQNHFALSLTFFTFHDSLKNSESNSRHLMLSNFEKKNNVTCFRLNLFQFLLLLPKIDLATLWSKSLSKHDTARAF